MEDGGKRKQNIDKKTKKPWVRAGAEGAERAVQRRAGVETDWRENASVSRARRISREATRRALCFDLTVGRGRELLFFFIEGWIWNDF
jgi:hypothetical protein